MVQPKAVKKGTMSPFNQTLYLIFGGLCLSVILLLRVMLSMDCSSDAVHIQLDPVDVRSVSSLRNSRLHQSIHEEEDDICRWYLAESAIPNSGLGLFTASGILPGEMVGFPDICIFVGDAPDHWTHLRSHTFGGGSFFGQYEGGNRYVSI